MDIGFNRIPEPIYYDHQVVSPDGSIQYWCGLTNNTRKDYIPSESFDIDIISFTIYNESMKLCMFIHIKGFVGMSRNISLLIAVVFDTTPMEENDEVNKVTQAPTQYGEIDTFLGTSLL